MTRLLTACPSFPSLQGLAFALVAIALHAALSAPDPGPFPVPAGAEAGPEAPSCVGCHSSEWPSPAPDGGAPGTLTQAERTAVADVIARRAP